MWDSKKQILFVTGKGGVGKSTVAAALACRAAREGKKVLLVELGDYSFYEKFFHLPSLTYKPQILAPRWEIALWTGETCLREYVLHYLKIEKIYEMFFENRIMRTFVNVAPGVSELAILGKITSGIRKVGPPMHYDLIVVDTYATGHFLSLIQAPKGLSEAIRSGPFGVESASIVRTLQDTEKVGYVIVTLPEPLPVSETKELSAALKESYGVSADIICNRILDSKITDSEFQKMHRDSGLQKEDLQKYFKYLEFVQHRQEQSLQELETLQKEIVRLPLVTEFSDNKDMIHKLCAFLPWESA
ncbi:MAG: ArsA-related P-loop ATPase [Bdellovibrionales bacterium]